MQKRYIWQNTNIDVDEWRDGYMEFCEINDIEPGNDEDIWMWAVNTNYEYLEDEKANLDKPIDGEIICIADLGLWHGRASGYKIMGARLNEIFCIQDDYIEYYGDGKNIIAHGYHHDGTNHYIFRAIRPGKNIENFLDTIYNGENITPAKLNYYTRPIYKDVAAVYGWY